MVTSSDAAPPGEVMFTARTDVTVEPQGEKFVIHDPRKNSFTQIGVAEYIVFRCFDGRSAVQDIVDRLKRERDVIVSAAQVARLRDRMHEKQLVIAPGEVVKSEDAKLSDSNGIVGRLVFIELPLVWNPDIFLTRVFHRIKYAVFRPAFFIALFVMMATAVTVWVQSIDAIRLQAAKLDVKSSFVLYYLCFSATFFLHECAHGVTCKGFGGKVPRIGTFLYFFLTTFYTDVSASWMFPSKFRRLMVLFAGALSNLALCALSTLVWRVTIQGSPVNQVCFALMTMNALAASLTLFPLLRGDGYYILSTAVDVPNLRQNAQRYFRAALRRTFLDRSAELPKATSREAIIYLCYAPLQMLFVVVFFGYVTVRAASWIIGELHFIGFWIIVFVLVDRLGRPLLRVVPGMLKLLAEALRLPPGGGPPALFALLTRPLRDAATWIAGRWKLGLVVASPIAVLALVPYQLNISAPCEVISSGPVTLHARTGGIVKQFLVETGQWVKAGDVVAVLLDEDLQTRRKTAEAVLGEARAKLAELEAGYRREDRAQAQVDLKAHQQATALAALELRRQRNLYRKQIASRKDLDEAVGAYRSALAREGEAQTELKMMAAGYREEELDRQRARVQLAEQELAAADLKLAWLQVRAVVDGRVVTPSYDLVQRVGRHVEAGTGLIDIVAPPRLAAILAVPERFMSDVSIGMPVTLRFFKDPDVAYSGRLDAIEPAVTPAANQPAGSLGMLTSLAHVGEMMPLGTRGIAKVDAGSQSILGLLLRRAHRSLWVVFWSWW
ncbi:MAG TPA: HlyD family efflux transporter periplasmic adaptor subunit [Kofleriaceae bacterium]|nr:HlyD family efflux transporter periplasmic adaptor subunit [Kofleriaceae bacterium]